MGREELGRTVLRRDVDFYREYDHKAQKQYIITDCRQRRF